MGARSLDVPAAWPRQLIDPGRGGATEGGPERDGPSRPAPTLPGVPPLRRRPPLRSSFKPKRRPVCRALDAPFQEDHRWWRPDNQRLQRTWRPARGGPAAPDRRHPRQHPGRLGSSHLQHVRPDLIGSSRPAPPYDFAHPSSHQRPSDLLQGHASPSSMPLLAAARSTTRS